jgi:hypothetical protein
VIHIRDGGSDLCAEAELVDQDAERVLVRVRGETVARWYPRDRVVPESENPVHWEDVL